MKMTKRNPYTKELTPTWWMKNAFYRFYMLREGTAFFAVWVSLLLLYGLGALHRGPENFACFVDFLANPLIMFINALSLLFALFHTKTWFVLAPKAIHVNTKQEMVITKGLWAATAAVTFILLVLALK